MPTTITSLRGLDGTTSDQTGRFAIFPPPDESDLDSLDDLMAAVVMSLHTDRRADVADIPPGTRRRGWWGSTHDEDPDDPLGSLLWAVMLRGLTTGAPEAYAQEARRSLAWLVEDGVAARVDVVTTRLTNGVQINVTIWRQAGDLAPLSYSYVWDPYYGG